MTHRRIEQAFEEFEGAEMILDGTRWWSDVPGDPGWYLVETNAPISVLAELPKPEGETRLYSIRDRVKYSQSLMNAGLAILPRKEGDSYIVYSGEQKSLKARAREHTQGDRKTGCLGLAYYPILKKYDWWFWYINLRKVFPEIGGDKALRAYGEQMWRALNGWPVLCKE